VFAAENDHRDRIVVIVMIIFVIIYRVVIDVTFLTNISIGGAQQWVYIYFCVPCSHCVIMVLYPSTLYYTLQPSEFQEQQQLVITCTTTDSLSTIPFVKLRPTTRRRAVRVHAFRCD